MSNVEFGPCRMEIYTAGVKNPIPEEQLKIGGLYVVRFALTEGFIERTNMDTELEALQLPARISGKRAPLPDRYTVDFSLLDLDFNVIRATSGQIRGGYILGKEEDELGYFKKYEGGCDEMAELEAEMAQLFPETFEMTQEPSVPMPITA